MSDALKRRCIHLYIDYPDRDMETRIVELKNPGISDTLVCQLVDAIREIRNLDLKKKPCISETLDWAQSLMVLQVGDLTQDIIRDTLSVITKYRSDTEKVVAYMKDMSKKSGL